MSNITITGATVAGGTFSGGAGLGFDTGLLISSGRVLGAANDVTGNESTDNAAAADTDLNTLTSSTTFDAFVLEFDFVPNVNGITFRYRFGSEEDFTRFIDDAFGLFVNGTNIALLPDNTRVSVINIGTGPYFESNSDNHLNNAFGGFSIELTASASVNPGVTNHMKIAIADSGDPVVDAICFIGGGTFESNTFPAVANASPIRRRMWTPFFLRFSGEHLQ